MLRGERAVLIDLSNEQGRALCLLTQGRSAITALKLCPLVSIKDQLTMKVYLGRGE